MYKHPKNVFKGFQKDISPRTKDIKQFNRLYTHTQSHAQTQVNLELTTRGGSAKKYSFKPNSKKLLASYLSDKTQLVQLNDKKID